MSGWFRRSALLKFPEIDAWHVSRQKMESGALASRIDEKPSVDAALFSSNCIAKELKANAGLRT